MEKITIFLSKGAKRQIVEVVLCSIHLQCLFLCFVLSLEGINLFLYHSMLRLRKRKKVLSDLLYSLDF